MMRLPNPETVAKVFTALNIGAVLVTIYFAIKRTGGALPMIPAELLAAVKGAPDAPESRWPVLDWLVEYGAESDWVDYLDRFPGHCDARERFGAWLTERGDRRGEVYALLGRRGWFPYYVAGQWTVGDYRVEGSSDRSDLPKDWYAALANQIEPEARNRSISGDWAGFPLRHVAEELTVSAFFLLPPERRAELLAAGKAVAA